MQRVDGGGWGVKQKIRQTKRKSHKHTHTMVTAAMCQCSHPSGTEQHGWQK